MIRKFKTPLYYVQGQGVLSELSTMSGAFGKKIIIFTDLIIKNVIGDLIEKSFKDTGLNFKVQLIDGICTHATIDEAVKYVSEFSAEVVVGVGGGAIMDIARSSSHKLRLPLVLCPTTASTNAPFTSIAVINDEYGHMVDALFTPFPPITVVADTGVIIKAPTRFLRAGIGDAMSSVIELMEVNKSNSTAFLKRISNIAYRMSKDIYRILLEEGKDAVIASDSGSVSSAFENVVEAIVFSAAAGSISLSHALYEGFRQLSDCNKMMHGEIVAFCSLVQLNVTEEKEMFRECCSLYKKVGLPVTLKDLNINRELLKEDYEAIVNAAFKSPCMANWVKDKSPEDIINAIKFVDAYGRE